MGTYKVPQNVEADDKILGPLSMKQFVYALIGLAYGALTFVIFKAITLALWFVIGVPPMLALLALGLYQRDDQPLETFVIAMVQFFVRPRVRFWEKEPIAEVFRLEPPPPKPEQVVRDPREVRSQLSQLADLVDTRGWSVKQPEVQEPDEVPVVDLQDRLGIEGLPVQNPQEPVVAGNVPAVTQDDDILNDKTATAQNLNTLIENSVKNIRDEALENMKKKAASKPHKPAAHATKSISGSTASPSGDILKLATEGGDLTVAQIAAQAKRHTNQLAEGQSVSIRDANATTA